MLTELISHPYTQALGWALVHFVWQGAAIGLIAFALLRVNRDSASMRYAIGVVTMGAMLAAPIATFLWLAQADINTRSVALVDPAAATTAGLSLNVVDGPMPSVPADVAATTRTIAPTLVLSVWLVGVVFFSLRLAGGWMVARRLAHRSTRPVTDEIQALARRVADRLALGRVVSVLESSAVSVPLMVGWLKPAVLLPAAALSGLSPTQIEALLAHELAHVRRHDYLVNLLQSVVETLLFYHPAVWWISRQVRKEREHCCDDLAVAVCDRLVYVTALADLASMTITPRLALAATDGSLIRRVRRILGAGSSSDAREPASSWLPLTFVILLLGALVPVATQTARPVEVGAAVTKAVEVPAPPSMSSTREAGNSAVAEVPSASMRSSMPARQERPIEVAPEQQVEAVATAQKDKAKVDLQKISEAIEGLRKKIDALVRGTTDDATLLAIQADLKKLDEQLRQSAGQGREEEQVKAKKIAAMQVAELESMTDAVKKKMMTEEFTNKLRDMNDENRRAKEVMASAEKMRVEEATRANGVEYKKQVDKRAFEAMDSVKFKAMAELNDGFISHDSQVLRDRALAGISKDVGGFFSDVRKLTSSHEQRRVIDVAVSAQDVSDDVVIGAIKAAGAISSESERASALMGIAKRQALTPDMVQIYISATSSIQSADNRARVLTQPVRLKEKGR